MQFFFVSTDETITEDHPESEHESSQSVTAVNRGGLIIVNDAMFRFFLSMELELKKAFFSGECSSNERQLKRVGIEKHC